MLRTDTGSFNRFLTSLGLVLLAFGFILPYFYFRNTGVLEIPESELRQLTDSARDTIRGRQDGVAWLEPFVIGLALTSAIGGIVLLAVGGGRLHEAQKREDREAEARTKAAEFDVTTLEAGEVEEKREREAEAAEQAASADADTDQPDGETQTPEPQREPEPAPADAPRVTPAPPSYRGSTAEFRKEIARVEERIFEVLRARPHPQFDFASQVRIQQSSEGRSSLVLDGLFTAAADSGYADVLLDIRVSRRPNLLMGIGRMWADALLANAARYQGITNREVFGWLVVVFLVDNDAAWESTKEEILRTRSRLDASVEPGGVVTILPESQLDRLRTFFPERPRSL